jgi:large subunit ribosomal protein L36
MLNQVAPQVHNRANRKERPMKVRKSLRSLKNKPGAQVVRRHGKVFVINKKEPRFKARQG